VHYAPLVKYIAARVRVGFPRSVEQADLASYGTFGLIDVIEKFDLELGYAFEMYAIARIKGAILDELRSTNWVPRSVRAKARNLEQAIATLEPKNCRAPTDAEVAEALGMTEAQLLATLGQISLAGVAALDEMPASWGSGESFTLGYTIADPEEGPMGVFEAKEMGNTLTDSIRRMPERERLALIL
jgi:RNA polymerase sigma factor for flagellar operon FliA